MKLLIVTQTLDTNDPVLSFFVRWVEEFAKQTDQVHVLALNVGEYQLPDNVSVLCLGKNEGKSKIVWLWRLWKYSWSLRHQYDAVFAHMNPEYIIFGALPWRFLRKRVSLWYAHGTVSFKLRLALWLSDFVFTSTERGLRIDSAKRMIVGQGIDTNHFKPDPTVRKTPGRLSLIIVGRISPSKGFETLLQAVSLLKKRGLNPLFSIYGAPQNELEETYQMKLKTLIKELKIENEVTFCGPVSQADLPNVLNKADFFIQDGRTGSLDKVLLEAVACELITISSNKSYEDFVSANRNLTFSTADNEVIASNVIYWLNTGGAKESVIKDLRSRVVSDHDIKLLVGRIIKVF